MAWCRTGDKPLPEPTLTQFTNTYICGTRGRWVNTSCIQCRHISRKTESLMLRHTRKYFTRNRHAYQSLNCRFHTRYDPSWPSLCLLMSWYNSFLDYPWVENIVNGRQDLTMSHDTVGFHVTMQLLYTHYMDFISMDMVNTASPLWRSENLLLAFQWHTTYARREIVVLWISNRYLEYMI